MPRRHPDDSDIRLEAPKVSAWTTSAELTEDQRKRFGGYVLAKEQALAAMALERKAQDRARAAMGATGGDKGAALALLMDEGFQP